MAQRVLTLDPALAQNARARRIRAQKRLLARYLLVDKNEDEEGKKKVDLLSNDPTKDVQQFE